MARQATHNACKVKPRGRLCCLRRSAIFVSISQRVLLFSWNHLRARRRRTVRARGDGVGGGRKCLLKRPLLLFFSLSCINISGDEREDDHIRASRGNAPCESVNPPSGRNQETLEAQTEPFLGSDARLVDWALTGVKLVGGFSFSPDFNSDSPPLRSAGYTEWPTQSSA